VAVSSVIKRYSSSKFLRLSVIFKGAIVLQCSAGRRAFLSPPVLSFTLEKKFHGAALHMVALPSAITIRFELIRSVVQHAM
jgi:hypothetical protein